MPPLHLPSLKRLVNSLSDNDKKILLRSPSFTDEDREAWITIIDTSEFESPYNEQVALFDGLYHCFRALAQHPKDYARQKKPMLKVLTDSYNLLRAKDHSLTLLLQDVDSSITTSAFSFIRLYIGTKAHERRLLQKLVQADKQLLTELQDLYDDIKVCQPKDWVENCSTFIDSSAQLCLMAIDEAYAYNKLSRIERLKEHLDLHTARIRDATL